MRGRREVWFRVRRLSAKFASTSMLPGTLRKLLSPVLVAAKKTLKSYRTYYRHQVPSTRTDMDQLEWIQDMTHELEELLRDSQSALERLMQEAR